MVALILIKQLLVAKLMK